MGKENDDSGAVRQIAEAMARLRFEELPRETVARARQVVLDFVGTTLGGCQTPLGRRIAEYAALTQRGQEATILGDGRTSTLEGAAWASGVTSCLLGMTETHRVCGHAATELVPPILALGERLHLDGRRLITALAAGYEVFGAIQVGVRSWQRARGLDHKSQAGSLAAAVAAGVAMGLDAGSLGHALALAADLASGTEQYTHDAGLCDTEGLLAGYAAANGIRASSLAAFGFRGPPGALDGPYGYYHAFGPGFDPAFLDSLRGPARVLAGTGFKADAGCRHVHACAEAVRDLLAKGRPPLDRITSIEVGTYRVAVTPAFRVDPAPANAEAAGYSLPATAAVMLARGSWYPEDIASYAEPPAAGLLPLVRVYLDEAIEADFPHSMGCVVHVTTRDGEVHEGRTRYPKGEPENMLSEAEFEGKFRRVAGPLLSRSRCDQILALAHRLEDVPDVGELVQLASGR